MPAGTSGLLTVQGRWPAMARTVWGDHARYRDAYWTRFAAAGCSWPATAP